MKRLQKTISICTLSILSLGAGAYDLVPEPRTLEEGHEVMVLDKTLSVAAPDDIAGLIEIWKCALDKPYAPGNFSTVNGFNRIVSGTELPDIVRTKNARKAGMVLSINPELADEEYCLEVKSAQILLQGGSRNGLWWGLQTLSQMLVCQANAYTEEKGLILPAMKVSDAPHFPYRGAMLDCSRHFFTVAEIKIFLDIMAFHKLNVFQWHLTDDQGWRIEIKKYPRLTEIGSTRKETLVGHIQRSKEYDGKPYGGFYTQDQIREIVAYATERGITIVPEIDMPGHVQGALTAYPELGCKGEGYEVRTTWGISKETLCLGKESTYRFLEDVLDEVAALFPGPLIHIGGDEARTGNWEKCPLCQTKMKELGLAEEHQLQGYLTTRIEKHLQAHGKKVIGWDELVEAGISKTAMVMSWRGSKGGIKAASQGNDVIMSPNTHFYLDYYQTTDPEKNGEPLAIGRNLPLEKCYQFNPYESLDLNTRKHIKGIQANVWTEYMDSFDKVMHMTLPRLAALSETAWSGKKTSYADFLQRIRHGLVPLYQYKGYIYAPYAFKTASFDENAIRPYTLPEVLRTDAGKTVKNASQWEKRRRKEILEAFTEKMYGFLPSTDVEITSKCLKEDMALEGKAIRRQVELIFSRNDIHKKALLLIYLPAEPKGKVPCFLGFNFQGNQTVTDEKGVLASQYSEYPIGNKKSRWDIGQIINAGYGLVTAHYYDFFYDKEDGMTEEKYPKSILSLWDINSSRDCTPDQGRAISTWAWAYSRILDYITASEPRIDAGKVAVMGHSRLGKAALWAGANDSRFAMVISNNSGCCGSAISKRRIGEDFHRILRFKHWFCKDFDQYMDNEEALSIDQHELMALTAPRPLYITSATNDVWSDPKGEWMAAKEASAVWELYGKHGLEGEWMPETGKSQDTGFVGYHIRDGRHDVTSLDWTLFIGFADKYLK